MAGAILRERLPPLDVSILPLSQHPQGERQRKRERPPVDDRKWGKERNLERQNGARKVVEWEEVVCILCEGAVCEWNVCVIKGLGSSHLLA